MASFLETLACTVGFFLACWLVYQANRYGITPALFTASPPMQTSLLQAARIRRHWPDLAQRLKLVSKSPDGKTISVPRMRTSADPFGTRLTISLVEGVGLEEFTKARVHLANAWGAVRISLTQADPGRITLRAVRVDPLASPIIASPADEELTQVPADLRSVELGPDEYGDPVVLPLHGISGITVTGLTGYGKSSLTNGLITRLAPSPAVQFGVLNGKDDSEYDELEPRLMFIRGEDLDEAHRVFTGWEQVRRWRSQNIRRVLGTKNFWDVGPSAEWPLLFLIVDECYTYFQDIKSTVPLVKAANAKRSEMTYLAADSVRKQRSVGMITVFLTQKGTGDAIPTVIRDNCPVSMSFALKTREAEKAALGDDILNYPDASPLTLQDPKYVGVMTMAVQGRPGFTRVRLPYYPPITVEKAAVFNAQHALRPKGIDGESLVIAVSPNQTIGELPSVSEPDDLDEE